MGYDFNMITLPKARVSLELRNGNGDGVIVHNEGYDRGVPNLVRVESVMMVTNISAFSLDPLLELNGWESLRGTGLRVDYIRGMIRSNEVLRSFYPDDLLFIIDDDIQGIERLSWNRSDLLISNSTSIKTIIRSEITTSILQDKIISENGIMEVVRAFPWITEQNHQLAGELAAQLNEMKRDGVFELYLTELGIPSGVISWE